METTMGKVEVALKVENLEDLVDARRKRITEGEVRVIDIPNALIDTGAPGFLMPIRLITQLGLEPLRSRNSWTIKDEVEITMYRAVQITIQDRDCICDVGDISDDLPAIDGQVPLELMDWVEDPKRQRLISNAEHGGEYMHDAL